MEISNMSHSRRARRPPLRQHRRRTCPAQRPIESLEPRRLLSTYVINGSAGNDTWSIETLPGKVFVNGTTFNVPGVTDVQVNGFDGADSVLTTHADLPIVFNGGNGDDNIQVHSGFMSAQINARITFKGDGGFDQVDCGDSLMNTHVQYTFGTDRLSWGLGSIDVGGFSGGAGVELLILRTSAAGSTVHMDYVTPACNTVIEGSGGADDIGMNLFGTWANVTVHGGGGNDTIGLEDRDQGSTTPRIYHIDPTRVWREGNGGVESYSSIESIILRGNLIANGTYNITGSNSASTWIVGGSANDTFNFPNVLTSETTIDAGNVK
jgi:hypothetical protein